MEPIQLTGLASGFDWKTVIDQLIRIERIPQARLTIEKAEIATEISTLGDLETKLKALQVSLGDLKSSSIFYGRSTTLGNVDSTTLTASAANNTILGSYSFAISQLATATDRDGSVDVGTTISASADVSGVTLATMNTSTAVTAGTFMINGQQVTVATTDSLQDVFDAINTATSGAVTATYSSVTDKITLTGSGTISLGSPNDSSNFLNVVKLFGNGTSSVTSVSKLGAVNLNASITSSGLSTSITNVDGDGDGTFTINGVVIAFNVNNDSVGAIIQRINDSQAGAIVTYDSENDKFVIVNAETGSLGLTVSETVGGFLEALGLNSTATLNLGNNANFTVNGGGTLISTSNVLDAGSHGITGLSVTAKETGTEIVNVQSDSSGIREKIETFIEKYNAVQSFIEENTKITVEDSSVSTSILTDNREVDALERSLRTSVFNAVPALTGTIKRLHDLGIEFKSGSNELEIVEGTALDDALEQDPGAVSTIFTDATDGLVVGLDSYIENYVKDSGILDIQTDTLESRTKSLQTQIDSLETYIEFRKEALTLSFLRMENFQAEINGQLMILSQFL